MTNIINFPGEDKRLDRSIDQVLDESLDISNPELRECVKTRVAETLKKHKSIPSLNIQVSLPEGVTEKMIQPVIDAISAEYRERVSEHMLELVTEICRLQKRLCKVEINGEQ